MKNTRKGFTLFELLITIAIIAILSTIVLGNYIHSLERGRDGRRKSDLHNLQVAFEQYYEDAKQYPPASAVVAGSPLSFSGTTYMQEIPHDPNGGSYRYCTEATHQEYQVYALLENENDVMTSLSPICPIPCFSGTCINYGVSSSNTLP